MSEKLSEKLSKHMTRELVKDQVLTEGFEIFKNLGLEFNEKQIKLMNKYLDALLEENILSLSNNTKIPVDDEVYDYINKLLFITLNLTIISFINWGIALYHYEK